MLTSKPLVSILLMSAAVEFSIGIPVAFRDCHFASCEGSTSASRDRSNSMDGKSDRESMYGIYLSASGAQAYNDYMEVLSNNIANSSTPGFKREFAVIKARPSQAIERGLDFHGSGTMNDVGGGSQLYETVTDFESGSYKTTGIQTDLAIADAEGDGFFVVEQDGQQFLTRAGNFQFDGEGVLRSQEGYAVLSSNGNEIRIDPSLPFEITGDGTVAQPQVGIFSSLAIERPQQLGDLVKVGNTMFRSLSETEPVSAEERNVKQGVLEMSTSNPIESMMDLIKVNRAYDANIKMIQHQDETVGSLINRVLGS